MNTSLKEFPFRGKSTDFPRSDYKTALEWKEAFEKELRLKLQLTDVNYGKNPSLYTKGRIEVILDILGDLKASSNGNETKGAPTQ